MCLLSNLKYISQKAQTTLAMKYIFKEKSKGCPLMKELQAVIFEYLL